MAKKVRTILKVQAPAGRHRRPAGGPGLGQHGINIMEFIKAFNERTADLRGYVVPAEITVYEDRSFTFVTKAPLAAALLKRAAGVESGSAQPNREKVGSVSSSSCARSPPQDAGPQRQRRGAGHADRGRHGAQHGDRGARLMARHGRKYREAAAWSRRSAAIR